MLKVELSKVKKKKHRLIFTQCFIFFIFFLLVGRLFYIMSVKSSFFKARAKEQWTSQLTIQAKRGQILDRKGQPLAVSAEVYRIDLDMLTLKQTLTDKKMSIPELADKLSDALDTNSKDILNILNQTDSNGLPLSSVTLKRKVEKDLADKVKQLGLRGIVINSDIKRYYPNDNFLSSVLGHIDLEGNGTAGVEMSYNKELSGTSGKMIFQTDNKDNELPYDKSQYTKPIDGKNVLLTIDERIQQMAEKAAEKAMVDNKSKAVTIMVTNPKNGEILGLANRPDYNLNSPYKPGADSDDLHELWKNRAVTDSFEPGSIFKVITAAAAMENNIVKENDAFVCNGYIKIGNTLINCWKTDGHGIENFVDILKNSCNVGFIELGIKTGKQTLMDYINKLGFGQKTGIDLPEESSGMVRNANSIGSVDLANISFGQGIAVTSVQYMAAYNAVANRGTWIRPHVMKSIVSFGENNKMVIDKNYSNYGEKRIIDEKTAAALRDCLEKVVTEGVGQKAFIEGYRIGGKTGTAEKINPKTGTYQPGKYIASFAGMAPVDDPKITILVSIDEPDASNYYAGQTAAPVARQLFADVFEYLELNPDVLK